MDRILFGWIIFWIVYFSDEAFDTYKFFQIGLASILLVTLPIMIGCLKFLLWISLNKCCNKQPKKVSALIYARRKLNQKNRNLVSEWNGCQSLLQILHLHLLKPMPQDEIPYFKDQYFILLKKWHTQKIQNLMIFSVFSAEQTLADEDTKSADTPVSSLSTQRIVFFVKSWQNPESGQNRDRKFRTKTGQGQDMTRTMLSAHVCWWVRILTVFKSWTYLLWWKPFHRPFRTSKIDHRQNTESPGTELWS